MKNQYLSPATLSSLKAIMAEEGAFESLASKVCETVPASEIPREAGKIPLVPAAMTLGSSAEDGKIGFTDPTTEVAFELTERDYSCQRLGFNTPVSLKRRDHDEVYSQAEKYVYPALVNKIHYEVDVNLLGEILRGDGLAADSRDTTVVDVGANAEYAAWDAEVGAGEAGPLDQFEEWLRKIGGSAGVQLILSTDRAQILQRNEQVSRAFHGNGTGRLGRADLAQFLADYLAIDRVVIGRKIFQDGDVTDSFNADYQMADVSCLTKSANLVRVPFGSDAPDFRSKMDEDSDVQKMIADLVVDVCTYDPAHTATFQNVKTA